MDSEMGPTVCRRGGLVQYSGHGEWRDVMTAVSGRGAHVLLLEAATVMVMSLVRALLLVILLFLKKVVQVKALLV